MSLEPSYILKPCCPIKQASRGFWCRWKTGATRRMVSSIAFGSTVVGGIDMLITASLSSSLASTFNIPSNSSSVAPAVVSMGLCNSDIPLNNRPQLIYRLRGEFWQHQSVVFAGISGEYAPSPAQLLTMATLLPLGTGWLETRMAVRFLYRPFDVGYANLCQFPVSLRPEAEYFQHAGLCLQRSQRPNGSLQIAHVLI